MIAVETAPGIAALGPEWDVVFAAGPGVQSRRDWFEATENTALDGPMRPLWLTVRQDGRPLALLPLQAGPGSEAVSLTSPYTVLFQPLLAPGADPRAIGIALAPVLRRWSTIRLEALDPAWSGLDPLLAGLRRGGLLANRFDHFGNWVVSTAGKDWPAYLAARPGALRETIRRRGRAAAQDKTIRFEVVQQPDDLPGAIAAYEAVYARSWKVPEPYPLFTEAVLPRLAAAGLLRLCVLWRGETPLAAQYWTVQDRVATVLKLAHDDAVKALSPGTLLTAHMIRRLLDDEHVDALDFGRGDDPYKASWTTDRRQRIGVVLANPLRPQGLKTLLRHQAGRLVRRLRGGRG